MAAADQATTLVALAQRQLDRVVSPSTRRETWSRTLDLAARRPGAFVRTYPISRPQANQSSSAFKLCSLSLYLSLCLSLSLSQLTIPGADKIDLPSPPNSPNLPTNHPLHHLRPLDLPPRPRRRGAVHALLHRGGAFCLSPVPLLRGRRSRVSVDLGRRVFPRCEVDCAADGDGVVGLWVW